MDISSMLEVQVDEVKEIDIKENVTPKDLLPSTTNLSSSISQDESNFYKFMFGNDISVIRFRKLHCTACDTHIGSAPAESHNMFEHPVLHTLLCAKCWNFYGDGTFEQGDDATDMFCRWCANGGNLYCCSFCSNTFCYKCIKRNFDPVLRKKIEADEKWKCFVCDPTDLYTARAVCWALRQHVQTMTSILQNNQKLTQIEIDEKMNLDETQCCPRRKKRKRRRTDSNSEEDDETYIPKQIAQTIMSRRKKKSRGRPRLSNGSSLPMHLVPPKSEENSGSYIDHGEILPSLLSCEQTMVECENATVNADGTIRTLHDTNFLPSGEKSTSVQEQLYNTRFVNILPTPNFLQSTPSSIPLRPVTGSLNHLNLFDPMRCIPTPMVAIPNQTATVLSQSRISVSESQTATVTTTVNVIEIESDSEDITVIGQLNNSSSSKNHTDLNNAVPVALVSSKNNYTDVKKREMLEKRNARSLNHRILPHSQEINNVLTNLKAKVRDLFESAKREEHKVYTLIGARSRIKQFHYEIRNTIMLLACINDRIVREYNKWKRHQSKVGVILSLPDTNNASKKDKSSEIPLDMTCINESDSDSENSNESEEYNIGASEFVGSTNVVEGMKCFRKKNAVNRAVGNDFVSTSNKSVQIFDIELQDYDKCINHSVLKTLNQEAIQDKHVSASCTKTIQSCSEDYEGQFLLFLQKCMDDQNIQADKIKDLPDPNETPLKDLIEANSPFISEMLGTMDESCNEKESETKSSAIQETVLDTCKTVDDPVKVINNTTDLDINKKPSTSTYVFANDSQKENESHKAHMLTNDATCVENMSDVQNSRQINNSTLDSEHNNEDCTIIDD